MFGTDDNWQANRVDMQIHSRLNKGHRYLLTVIDIMSKYAWAVPTPKKTGEWITRAMRTIFATGRICEIFTIKSRHLTRPYTYKLQDFKGQDIAGSLEL